MILRDGERLVVAHELGKDRATPRGFVTGLTVSETARGETRSRAEADLAALMFARYRLDMMVHA